MKINGDSNKGERILHICAANDKVVRDALESNKGIIGVHEIVSITQGERIQGVFEYRVVVR